EFASVRATGLEDRRYRFVHRRRPQFVWRHAPDVAALWGRRSDLRGGAGASGRRRIFRLAKWQYETVKFSDDRPGAERSNSGARHPYGPAASQDADAAAESGGL